MTSTRGRSAEPPLSRRSRRLANFRRESSGEEVPRWRGEALTSRELLYILWGRRWIVLAITLLCLAVAAAYTLTREPAYTAEAHISLVEARGSLVQGQMEDFLESASGVIASDDELLSEAVSRSGWEGDLPAFREGLDPEYYTQSNNAPGVEVRFTASSPETAARAANAYAELLSERLTNLEVPGLSGSANATATVERRAWASNTAPENRPLVHMISAGLAGLILSGTLAVLLDVRTRSWRGAADAEMTLHAPVIGSVPDYSTLVGQSFEESDEEGRA